MPHVTYIRFRLEDHSFYTDPNKWKVVWGEDIDVVEMDTGKIVWQFTAAEYGFKDDHDVIQKTIGCLCTSYNTGE